MPKNVNSKSWSLSTSGGRKHSNPTNAITAPTLTFTSSTINSITFSISGGSNATGWVLQYKTSIGSWGTGGTTLTVGDQSYTITSLSQNTTYDIRIKCTNTYYTVYSSTLSPATQIDTSAPVAPTLTAGSPNSTSLQFTISGGSNATSWAVQYKLASDSSWTTYGSSITVGATLYTLSGLTSSTAYNIRIHTTNAYGSTDSNIISATTNAPVVTTAAISVSGNQLVSSSGQTIQLRGWNIAGNEYAPIQGWSPTDPSGGNSPPAHVYSDWKVNCVRIPLNEAAWNNTWTYDTDGKLHVSDPGQNYRTSIIAHVAAAKSNGAFVILDLHWTSPSNIAPMQQDCMANYDNSIPFWTSVANTFKGDTSVMFELFNEPTLGQQNGTLQPARTGTATGGSGTTLVDNTKSWKINQFAGGTLKNTTTGDQSTIISNTPTTLTTTGNSGTVSGNGYQITAPFVTLMEGGYVDQAIGNSNNSTYRQINMVDLSAYTGVNLWPGDTITQGGTTATVIGYDPTNSKVYFKDWSGSFSTGSLNRTAGRKGATLISRSLSQAPSVSSGTAADLVSNNYNNRWRSSGTVNGQYCSFYIGDKVSAGLRNVTLFWMQDATYGFRPDLTGGGTYYNCPGSYQIRVNTAGAGARPTSGWYTIETITGNKYTKRMHTVSMTGDWKWVEIYFTASEGSAGNSDIEIKCDLYDSTYGLPNSVLIIGDSISANSLLYKNQGNATSAFPDLANAAGGWAAGDYPLMVNGGIPGWSCSNWLGLIDEVLTLFPTRFVEFAMGTNDSGDGTQGALTAWSANILTLSNKVKALGRTVLWDTIPYAADLQHGSNTVNYNTALAAVITSNPWIMNGVNRYALGNITQGSIDPIHPSDPGISQLRSAYATFYSSLSLNITATISNANATWRIAGMQEMLNAVRAAGATNVCMVSGNGWNDDLSGVLANIPTDSASNLAVAWHPYPPTQKIKAATITAGGNGYAVGNTVKFARPSNACLKKATATIDSISSGGVVTGISFADDESRGLFLQNHLPTGNLVQESSTGGGTGLQISVPSGTGIGWDNQGSQWSMPANWPTVQTIMQTYPLVCTETGEVTYPGASGSQWITDITTWADTYGAGVIFWQINAAGWYDFEHSKEGENVLTKDKEGTPADGYGVTAYNWLYNHA